MSLEFLQILWYILIGVLLAGYAVLDGFDLGVACLMRFTAKDDKEKAALMKTVSPFWDGNEVWLLTGGGALFAAFPLAYATIFSAFYLALMLVLFALIFRAVSIEFYHYDKERKGLWEWAFILGSFLPSLLFGVALGNVIIGIPLNENGDFTGNFFTLLRPYPLTIGVFGLIAILYHGANYLVFKTKDEVRQRALNIVPKLRAVFFVMLILSGAVSAVFFPHALKSIPAWICAFLAAAFLGMNSAMIKKGNDKMAFVSSALSFIMLWGIVGTIHFPNLVKGLPVEGAARDFSLTIYNASSGLLTLKVMAIIAIIGMPIVIGYSIFVYSLFKEKIGKEDKGYYY